MRIISKFKDVYDLQHSMADNSAVWNRKTEHFKVRCTDGLKLLSAGYLTKTRNPYYGLYSVQVQMVFVAGSIYPLFVIEYGGKVAEAYMHAPGAGARREHFMTFNPEKFVEQALMLGAESVVFHGEWDLRADNVESAVRKFMTKFEENSRVARSAFETLNSPLVLVDKVTKGFLQEKDKQEVPYWDLYANFCFNDLRLPWQDIEPNLYILHQILEQYQFGVLGGKEPEMISISDKDRLEAHGFDSKTSFRSMERP